MEPTRYFPEMLSERMASGRTVCVGLDSDILRMPPEGQAAFNMNVVDATAEVALAYKPNIAFYEGVSGGIDALSLTIAYIRQRYPDIPVILDAKRGDIDSSNLGSIQLAFDRLRADAITVHWYMGLEKGMRPFIERKDKGIIVLCRTSNKGAAEHQSRQTEVYPEEQERWGVKSSTLPMYQVVAHSVLNDWNVHGNCGLVVGATAPAELGAVRRIVGDMPILIPGLGEQEGEAEATVKAGMTKQGFGMIINSSRGIIFAGDPGQAAKELHEQVNTIRHQHLMQRALNQPRASEAKTEMVPFCYQCGNNMSKAGIGYACPSCGNTVGFD